MRVLIPVDGSPASLNAVRYGLGLREMYTVSVQIELLNVQPSMRAAVAQFIERDVIDEFHAEQGEEALASAKALLLENGADFDATIAIGAVSDTIVEQAVDKNCTAIVMGRSGLEGVAEWLLGSTTNKVLHAAKIPVTVVP